MKSIPTTIIGHLPLGRCSITGKDNSECFVLRVGNGQPQQVCVGRIIELLRWNCSIDIGSNQEPKTPSLDK